MVIWGNILTDSIKKNVSIDTDFKSVAAPQPVLSIQVKPDMIPQIIGGLNTLKGRTNDSEVIQTGNKYSFMDKRSGQPLADIDAGTGTMNLYKTPKDMAARIDSIIISESTINKFLADSKAPAGVVPMTPVTPAIVVAAKV